MKAKLNNEGKTASMRFKRAIIGLRFNWSSADMQTNQRFFWSEAGLTEAFLHASLRNGLSTHFTAREIIYLQVESILISS